MTTQTAIYQAYEVWVKQEGLQKSKRNKDALMVDLESALRGVEKGITRLPPFSKTGTGVRVMKGIKRVSVQVHFAEEDGEEEEGKS